MEEGRKLDRPHRQTDSHYGRQTDRQTEIQTDGQISLISPSLSVKINEASNYRLTN